MSLRSSSSMGSTSPSKPWISSKVTLPSPSRSISCSLLVVDHLCFTPKLISIDVWQKQTSVSECFKSFTNCKNKCFIVFNSVSPLAKIMVHHLKNFPSSMATATSFMATPRRAVAANCSSSCGASRPSRSASTAVKSCVRRETDRKSFL